MFDCRGPSIQVNPLLRGEHLVCAYIFLACESDLNKLYFIRIHNFYGCWVVLFLINCCYSPVKLSYFCCENALRNCSCWRRKLLSTCNKTMNGKDVWVELLLVPLYVFIVSIFSQKKFFVFILLYIF